VSAFFFDYCTYPDIIPHKRLYIHNPAICHSLCLSHEHSSYDIGLDNGIDNADDIDDQPNPNIYQYEKNGNLRWDNQEHIQLEWTMAGKVKKVINTLTTNTKAEFLYDAMGNRVRKTVYTSEGNVERNIFYTYAPDGKLLQMTEQSNEGLLLSMEYPLYGISRLGLYKVTSSLSREDESANLHIFPRYFDRRMYELTDHLGNVRAVVGDRKLWNSSFAGEFRANVLSVSNYYPFGMAQTGRNWDGSNGNYRYGYNGKEEDNEIKTNSGDNGKSLDYGARWYDPRKARWDAVDKYEAKYVGISPYVFTGNNPIIFKEIDGHHFGLIINHFERPTQNGIAGEITIKATFADLSQVNGNATRKFVEYLSTVDQAKEFYYILPDRTKYLIRFDIKESTVPRTNGKISSFNGMSEEDKKIINVFMGELPEHLQNIYRIGNKIPQGLTLEGRYMYLSRDHLGSEHTQSHEAYHALGGYHVSEGGGIPDEVYNPQDPRSAIPLPMTVEILNDILGTAGLGPRAAVIQANIANLKAQGTTLDMGRERFENVGSEPANFKQGHVEKIEQQNTQTGE